VLEVTARLLRRNQYSVLAATTESDALSLAADHEFDLLLTDLVMPQISGRELAERIQELRPGVAVLFMSGYSPDVPGPQHALGEGVAVLQKPFTAQALLENVHAAIAEHGPPDK
jgi:CheY-like chemotaxis protein